MAESSGMVPPTPTEQHELFKPFIGTFRSEVKIWFGPGEPKITSGIMTNSLQVNGLYLHQDFVGEDNPDPNGSAFVGQGFWGFNTMLDRFEGFWIDNASTMMQMEYGQVDDSGKVWEMLSELDLPGRVMKKRTVIALLDDDHHKMETFCLGEDGSETKNMEINYSRI